MNITFVTGNQRKLGEAKQACKDFDIEVEQKQLEIDEIQNHDPIKISIHKANTAFKLLKRPIVVNDSSWTIPALNNFPGGYMKDIAEWFTSKDFINLMKDKADKRIGCIETVIYRDKDLTKIFHKEFWGEIATKPKGKSGNSIERVAIFNGKTLAEFHDEGRFAYESKDYIWHDFAKWYAKKINK
ncbi:MAG: non-canonical purine NTP pyrophosphatase [Candidatus Saccharibacteria bacterium]